MTKENIVLDGPITETEIKKCVANLKNNKSAGIDHIINEYIKSTGNILCPLCVILDTAVMPEEWLVGCIIPTYKGKEDQIDVNSYRGITLSSYLGKLFASILNARLIQYCDGIIW